MKNNLNLVRRLSTLLVLLFTMTLVIVAFNVSHASDTNIKVGKYRVGINYSPLSACAVWVDSTGYIFRAVNASEYLSISNKVLGLDVNSAVTAVEKIAVTRELTEQERTLCVEVVKLDLTALKAVPAPNGNPPNTRKTKDITATTYTKIRVPDASLCEGAMIKKYRINQNWFKVKGLNLTTLCGEY